MTDNQCEINIQPLLPWVWCWLYPSCFQLLNKSFVCFFETESAKRIVRYVHTSGVCSSYSAATLHSCDCMSAWSTHEDSLPPNCYFPSTHLGGAWYEATSEVLLVDECAHMTHPCSAVFNGCSGEVLTSGPGNITVSTTPTSFQGSPSCGMGMRPVLLACCDINSGHHCTELLLSLSDMDVPPGSQSHCTLSSPGNTKSLDIIWNHLFWLFRSASQPGDNSSVVSEPDRPCKGCGSETILRPGLRSGLDI